MRHKIKHIYLYVCITIIALNSALLGYWEFWPTKIMTIAPTVKMDKAEYTAGDRITYTLNYCKKKDFVGTVTRSLVNGTRTTFTEMKGNLPAGCHSVRVSDLVIPEYLDGDTYHLEATIQYKVNPIRKINVDWRSENFIIKRNTNI